MTTTITIFESPEDNHMTPSDIINDYVNTGRPEDSVSTSHHRYLFRMSDFDAVMSQVSPSVIARMIRANEHGCLSFNGDDEYFTMLSPGVLYSFRESDLDTVNNVVSTPYGVIDLVQILRPEDFNR